MANKLPLGEHVVEAMIAKLQAGWATRAAEVNADYADDIVIAAPDTALYFNGREQQLPAVPAVFVMEGPATFNQNDQEGPHSLLSTFQILVYIIDEDFTGSRLAKRLERQARCVIETLYDDAPQEKVTSVAPFAGSNQGVYRLMPLRTVPGTVFEPSAGDLWRTSYTIVFRAQQAEL